VRHEPRDSRALVAVGESRPVGQGRVAATEVVGIKVIARIAVERRRREVAGYEDRRVIIERVLSEQRQVHAIDQNKPATLVVWGRYDSSFISAGAEAYKRDLPDAEIHLLAAGYFALDEKVDEIAALMLDFLHEHVD
jgi:pimeloyl-ACP methyl ester carboxylesterase